MYQDIINFINTYIKTNGQGEITGSRLNQVLNMLANYYGFDGVTVTTLPAGSDATATVTNRTLNLGIPAGQSGRDGVDATNPFKGWWIDLNSLKAAYTATEGDSAYVKNGAVWDIYIYDSTASSDKYWADSGTDADTTGAQTFQTGESLNSIGITEHQGDSTSLIMTQKGVTDFVESMVPSYVDEKSVINNSAVNQALTPIYKNDYYISASGIVTLNPSIGYSRIESIPVSEGDIINMNFILHKVNTNAFTTVRFGWSANLPEANDQMANYGYIEMPTAVGTYNMTKEFVAQQNGYLNISYNYHVSDPSNSNHITDVEYYKVLDINKTFVFRDLVGESRNTEVSTLEDSYIDTEGEVKSYSTPDMIHIDRIRVKAGDRVIMDFDFNKTENPEFKTCRYAYFTELPVVGSTCISGSNGFVPMPLNNGEHKVRMIFTPSTDCYLAISYKYAVTATPYVHNVSYHIINYGSRVGKIACLGDSITYGYIPHGLTGNPDGQLESYAKIASDALNMTLANYGISGNYLIGNTAERYAASMCSRFGSMDDDADIITFMGGTNDIRGGVPLGTMSDRVTEGDTNTYTYYAGLHKLIEGLYRKYVLNSGKTVKLIGITPPKMVQTPASAANGVATLYPNFDKWADAFKEVCAYYGIPVCDFFGSGLIAAQLASTWQNTAYSNTGYFNPLIPDGVHPSAIGQQYLGEYLANFINSL